MTVYGNCYKRLYITPYHLIWHKSYNIQETYVNILNIIDQPNKF